MRFLVIGLGSMGKRRVRCLAALGHRDVVGFDVRADRRSEAERLSAITTVDSLERVAVRDFDAVIVSVPPDLHARYLALALEHGVPAFVEASVVVDGLRELERRALAAKVLLAPSCTLRFHPAIRDIRSIVTGGEYGRFTNFSYHSGQYLPDWHPWERVGDYYVSKPETGGAREIVPFELTWIVDVLGFPLAVRAHHGRTMDVGAAIDDTYALSLRFAQGFGTLLVDVVSRSAVRSLVLNLEHAQILWRWDEPAVRVYDARRQRWISYGRKEASAFPGYNKNIIEDMYVDELGLFIAAVRGEAAYPHSLADDIRVLELLLAAEHDG